MTPAAAFRQLLNALERLNIPYLVTGSVASSFYDGPRATRDIDLVAVASVLDAQRGTLDLDYLREWAQVLGIHDLLVRVLSR